MCCRGLALGFVEPEAEANCVPVIGVLMTRFVCQCQFCEKTCEYPEYMSKHQKGGKNNASKCKKTEGDKWDPQAYPERKWRRDEYGRPLGPEDPDLRQKFERSGTRKGCLPSQKEAEAAAAVAAEATPEGNDLEQSSDDITAENFDEAMDPGQTNVDQRTQTSTSAVAPEGQTA